MSDLLSIWNNIIVIGAQAHMAGSELIPEGRLLGLEAVPQEFHHRGIYLQVSHNSKLIFMHKFYLVR